MFTEVVRPDLTQPPNSRSVPERVPSGWRQIGRQGVRRGAGRAPGNGTSFAV